MDGRYGRAPARQVLLIWESKHGSTTDISYAVAARLRASGVRVDLFTAAEASVDKPYDGYVIGSAVYAGHWMRHVMQFVRDYTAKLQAAPVWLFSSGPVGDPPTPHDPPVDITEVMTLTGAHSHQVFGGKLDPQLMSFPERAITRALKAPYGDFRNWDAIEAWAAQIAEELTREQVRS